MIRTIFIQLGRFIVIILFQIWVLNKFSLGTYLNPYLYPLFILMLPISIRPWLMLVVAFLVGQTMDLFMDSGGMHTMATVFMGYMRLFFVQASLSPEQLETIRQPDIASTSIRWFLFYAGLMIFFHHFILFFAESFTFSEFWQTLQRIIISSFLGILLVMLCQFLFFKVRPVNE